MALSLDQWDVAIGAASLLVAVLALVAPPTRRRLVALARRLIRLSGSDERRYRSWFAELHGTVHNVYLDRREDLTLRDTYVPLAGYRGAEVERVAAGDVLVDPTHDRLIILGDPGTGKSTLLRAFGTSLAAPGRADGRATLRGTPVFVALRHLVHWLDSAPDARSRRLESFVEREILAAAEVRRPCWPPCWPVLALVGMACISMAGVAERGWQAFLIAPGAVWLNLLHAVPPLLAAVAAFGLAAVGPPHLRLPSRGSVIGWPSWPAMRAARVTGMYLPVIRHHMPANPLVPTLDGGEGLSLHGRPRRNRGAASLLLTASSLTLPLAVALRVVLPPDVLGLTAYLVVATVVIWLVFWLPATEVCCSDVDLQLRRRNPLLALYDDPACGHWLVPQADVAVVVGR